VTLERLYGQLVRRSATAEAELPDAVRREVPGNGVRQVVAQALQSSGDHTVNASTVLPWLLHALGAPTALVGLLVPIRESLSMLPQALLMPLILRRRQRKRVFVAGALVQAAAAGAMALTAALGEGLAAGLAIVAALAVFALARCLCSIASKDVQGRTIPKGERGQVTGLATTAGGVAALLLGTGVRVLGGADPTAEVLAWVIAGGAVLWVLAAAMYARVREPDEDPGERAGDGRAADAGGPAAMAEVAASANGDATADAGGPAASADAGWLRQAFGPLRDDRELRRFVTVRSLLLVSALTPPFLVSLAAQAGSGALAGLGAFIVSAGLAALLGGPIMGRLADRSSRTLMSVGAGLAAAIVLLVVAVTALPGFDGATWWGAATYIGAYFALTLTHTGVRVARKTYIVDMADGDRRTRYVAVSNSAMGVILLAVGGVSAALALVNPLWALLLLAALGLAGVIAARGLPEVSAA